ncbi:MAG: 1-acyl-sn-glycerol-3-phosphate acyltransferase [Acidobacteria bacterium]|nr:1-acyl-sn-glycerol-3-phosphate acyltransferase [Acidobacteriota bacterium]
MKLAIRGCEGPLASQTREETIRRGHQLSKDHSDAVIYLPHAQAGSLAELEQMVAIGGFRRLVLRSHAMVYGANPKNPGFLTEERVSLLPERAPEIRWLRAEQIAARFGNTAILRLTNVLAPEEGDLLVKQIAGRAAMPLAGRDPQVQFIGLKDAAQALVQAAESKSLGVVNVASDVSLPFKKALRAAGTTRLAVPKNLQRLFRRKHSLEQMEFNWTVSGDRAARELGFRPEQSTAEALAQFVAHKSGARTQLLEQAFDPWGLDVDYIRAWGAWFAFLRKIYWRIEFEGMEHIPAAGRGIFVSNHRGFMPLDAVMHLSLVLNERGRIIRFLIIPCLLYFPFLSNFLTKLGGVIASQENAAKLFEGENLVGIFPEGIRGTFTPYKSTYQLRDFAKSAFAQLAIEHQTPIIPVAVIGHAEIFPIIGRINSTYLKRKTGWPYFPIAPPFPVLPVVPFPTKWHIRVLEPVSVAGLSPDDAHNEKLVRDLSRHVQDLVQQNINHMLSRRKHIFWGKVLDGTAPAVPPFHPARHAVGA